MRLLATPGALAALATAGDTLDRYLSRFAARDWGDVGAEDSRANDRAMLDGGRILAAYVLSSGARLWIITEADRSATTLLLPDEY